jgi:hypothetical protein
VTSRYPEFWSGRADNNYCLKKLLVEIFVRRHSHFPRAVSKLLMHLFMEVFSGLFKAEKQQCLAG